MNVKERTKQYFCVNIVYTVSHVTRLTSSSESYIEVQKHALALYDGDIYTNAVMHWCGNDRCLANIRDLLRGDESLKCHWDDTQALLKAETDLWRKLHNSWPIDVIRSVLKDKTFERGGDRRSAQYRT